MTTLRVCTYNIGARVNDYMENLKYNEDNYEREHKPEKDSTSYSQAQEKTGDLLTAPWQRPHIYCLQEVGPLDLDRPLINRLVAANFAIIHFEGAYRDSVVALDRTRFSQIENHSFVSNFENRYVAVATAVDHLTGQSVVIASAHVPGFSYLGMKQDREYGSDRGKDRAESGDALFTRELIPMMNHLAEPNTLQIIGADMNADPEIWPARFESLENASFDRIEPDSFTNVHLNFAERDHPELKTRKIDYLFTRVTTFEKSILQRISEAIGGIFFATFTMDESIFVDRDPLDGFNPECNASDHRPVYAEITYNRVPSWVEGIYNFLIRA